MLSSHPLPSTLDSEGPESSRRALGRPVNDSDSCVAPVHPHSLVVLTSSQKSRSSQLRHLAPDQPETWTHSHSQWDLSAVQFSLQLPQPIERYCRLIASAQLVVVAFQPRFTCFLPNHRSVPALGPSIRHSHRVRLSLRSVPCLAHPQPQNRTFFLLVIPD